MIYDTFLYDNEADILECRLRELEDVPDLVHILVEADHTVGCYDPKPFSYLEEADRFAPWRARIVAVQWAMPELPGPWARERQQREATFLGLSRAGALATDVVFHGDVDELLPVEIVERADELADYAAEGAISKSLKLRQRLHCFAVDWQHPDPWWGTAVAHVGDVTSFTVQREGHGAIYHEEHAGWHLSWLGTPEWNEGKMDRSAHVGDEWYTAFHGRMEECWRTGLHLDGKYQLPVDVGPSWPRWIYEGNAPESWYRPRG